MSALEVVVLVRMERLAHRIMVRSGYSAWVFRRAGLPVKEKWNGPQTARLVGSKTALSHFHGSPYGEGSP